jgi:ATP-dependent Clp protease, protease subunit
MRFSALLALFGQSGRPAAVGASEDINALLKQRVIFLGSPIDDATANDVITKLLFLDMDSSTKPIHLVINSPGGLVLAGLAIMDTMDKVRAPVATHCLGTAHSMAAVILAYGRAKSRTAEANSIITFTLPRAPDGADEQKKKDAVRLGEILIAKTAKAAGRPVAEIRKIFEQGTELSAPDAVVAGVIDGIAAAPR